MISNQFKGILVAALALIVVGYLCYNIYYAFPGTPATIFMLLLSLAGVLSAVGLYRRFTIDTAKSLQKHTAFLPAIEPDLLYVSLDDFVNKHEKVNGNLYLAGEKINKEEIKLTQVNFNKLLDEFSLDFSSGIRFAATDIKTVGVGDYQFVLFGFDQAVLKNKADRKFKMSNKLVYEVTKEGEIHFTLPKTYPVLVFTWEEGSLSD